MQPILYNDFWLATDNRIGPWHVAGGTVTQMQKDNANNIKTALENEGWTLNAICGILGNMMGESTLNPAFIQQTNRFRLPNSGADLTDVPNTVMETFYPGSPAYATSSREFGIGLCQWNGSSNRLGYPTQKLVGYAIDNGYEWYEGWIQVSRLLGELEYETDPTDPHPQAFFKKVRVSGVEYTFASFVQSTASPTNLAKAWAYGYERNAGGLGYRGQDAEWWYSYFNGPDAPEPVEDPDIPPDPVPVHPDNPFTITVLLNIFRKRREMLKPPCRRI